MTILMDKIEPVFKLRDDPIYCPSGYSLDLYCKYENPDHEFKEFPHSITDEGTQSKSIRAARKRGWLIHRDNTAICPKCAKRLKAMK